MSFVDRKVAKFLNLLSCISCGQRKAKPIKYIFVNSSWVWKVERINLLRHKYKTNKPENEAKKIEEVALTSEYKLQFKQKT